MYGGLQETTAQETAIINRLKITKAGPHELAESSQLVLDWIQEKRIQHMAIHLDLDVIDPKSFRSLLFAQPDGSTVDAPNGEMTLLQIARIIQDVSRQADVVGLAIAEHLPWDAINLKKFLESLPIFGK